MHSRNGRDIEVDAKLSRSQIVKTKDPHDWNSYDHYCTIHEKRLAEHTLVDESQPNTLKFGYADTEGVILVQAGLVFCKRKIILEVEKWFQTRSVRQRLQVRGVLYRYVAWVFNGHSILRYHNLHADSDEYIHRAFDPKTGKQILYEVLTRLQFPLFTEVLDEIDLLTADL